MDHKEQRQTGYFWVKQNNEWFILTWDGTQWTNKDCLFDLKDTDFDEIDENRIERETTIRPDDYKTEGNIAAVQITDLGNGIDMLEGKSSPMIPGNHRAFQVKYKKDGN